MPDLSGMQLTFDDEFNSRSISQTGAGTKWADIRNEWRFDANSDIGFGHSSFVDAASGYDPFNVSNGVLTITAVPDRTPYGYPGSWESGLITTQNTFSQTYGYFEMRADLSNVVGAWDAFWLLPDKSASTTNSGGQELDIVEHYGDNDRGIYSTIHTTDPVPNNDWQDYLQIYSEEADPSGYHTYGLMWTPDTLSFYIDGNLMGTKPTPSDMHGPMYILADLAVQGVADPNGADPQTKIDYIRAYALPSAAPAVNLADDFSTTGYLAANSDVRAAGVDPIQHYEQDGWKEGRDPSASFDTTLYLLHNPDVKAAGVDPLEHYLEYGKAEGRQAYAAIGTTILPDGFDPEYYLLSNPDVAAAAIASGENTYTFAYQHYETYGWKEGRNPNAWFDDKGYLAAYTDVATSGLSPLDDYAQHGWKEGRDPSAAFDTDAYLAHYHDVAAADIDPLTHYLEYGAYEMRSTFGDGAFHV